MAARNIVPRVLRIHIRLDPPRSDGIDGNVLVPRVNGEAARECLDGSLGAGVERVVRDPGHGGRDGGGQDDAAVVGEVAQGVLRDEELAPRVQGEDLVVDGFGDVVFGAKGFHAGVGDDDVQAAEVGDGFVEEVGHFGRFGDVGLDGDGFAAEGFDFRDDFFGG